LLDVHKRDRLTASRNYQALFRGESSDAADVAGMELDRTLKLLCAWVMAHAAKQ